MGPSTIQPPGGHSREQTRGGPPELGLSLAAPTETSCQARHRIKWPSQTSDAPRHLGHDLPEPHGAADLDPMQVLAHPDNWTEIHLHGMRYGRRRRYG